jgi:hypothetical protein
MTRATGYRHSLYSPMPPHFHSPMSACLRQAARCYYFGAVQVTMIGYGIGTGERLRGKQFVGLMLAFGGLIGLLLPGLSAPSLTGSVLMIGDRGSHGASTRCAARVQVIPLR